MKINLGNKTIIIDFKVMDNRPIQRILFMFKEKGFERGNIFSKGLVDKRIELIKLLRTKEYSKILLDAEIVPQNAIYGDGENKTVGLLYSKEFIEFYMCDFPSSHFDFEKVK